MTKHIWIPDSEMQVRVTPDGGVTVWEDMTMTRKPLADTGFQAKGDLQMSDPNYRERRERGDYDAPKPKASPAVQPKKTQTSKAKKKS